MNEIINIAIDGPAGSGKSTIAKKVATELGIRYMDTGAMYRGIACALLRKNIRMDEKDKVIEAIKSIDISVEYDENGQHIMLEKEDLNPYLRTPEVTKASSDVAVIPEVREKLVALQQETAKKYSLVMDGRDIGTVVLPDAPLKIFMTASAHIRAIRRKTENDEKGIDGGTLEEIEAQIIARDKTDSQRKASPLKQADDAVFIDTSDMGIEEVAEAVLKLAKERF